MNRVFAIVGWKNSGKTTLVARLVEHFSRAGLQVSTLKHASDDFTVDQDGTDTQRHAAAGAAEVAILSGDRFALMRHRGETQTMQQMLQRLAPCDLILLEGFKSAAVPKIQVMGMEARQHDPLWPSDPLVLAVAGGEASDLPVPVFSLDDIEAIAEFVLREAQEPSL